eukprot:m51a1_g6875 hypothetical protein (1067) ;mRNA; f:192225-196170
MDIAIRGAVSLVASHTACRLRGRLLASCTATRVYRNSSASALEARLAFASCDPSSPSPPVVCGLRASVRGQALLGRAVPRPAAFERYDAAVAAGGAAVLLERDESDGSCVVSLGPVLPGELCSVSVDYVVAVGPGARLALPVGCVDASITDDVRAEAQAMCGLPGAVSVRVEASCEAPERLASLASPSHPAATSRVAESGSEAVLEYACERTRGREDVFVVQAQFSASPELVVLAERDPQGGSTAFVAVACPRAAAGDAGPQQGPCEFVFVVDCSGSMSGSRIERAKQALQLCLRGIPESSLFNIYTFGSTWKSLWKESLKYNEANFKVATEFVSKMAGDMGGTEILQPLQHILTSPAHAGFQRQLFCMTDGEVSEEDRVVNWVAENAKGTRVFSFAIGAEASQRLVSGIAKASGGMPVSVKETEDIPQAVMLQLGRSLRAGLESFGLRVEPGAVNWIRSGGAAIAFAEDSIAYIGFVEESVPEVACSFEYRVAGQNARVAQAVGKSDASETCTLHKLVVGMLIEQGMLPKARVSPLALRHNLMSKETSFVVVNESKGTAAETSVVLQELPDPPRRTTGSGRYCDTSNFDPSFTADSHFDAADGDLADQFSGFTYTDKKIDAQLSQISQSVCALKCMSASMADEMEDQSKLLDELDMKLECSKAQLRPQTSVLSRAKSAIKSIFHRSDRDAPSAPASSSSPPAATTPSVSAAAAAAAAPQEKYELLQVVGKGSFGKTLRARDKTTGAIVTLEVGPRSDPDRDTNSTTSTFCGTPEHIAPEFLTRASKGGRAVSDDQRMQLAHPFLLKLISSSTTNEKRYRVFEMVDSVELFFLVQKNKHFSEVAVRGLIAEMVCLVEWLHSKSLSLGQYSDDEWQLTLSGHLLYKGANLVEGGSPEADWWALGSILYELLCGLPPFWSDNVAEMYQKTIKGQVTFQSSLSSQAVALLSQLLDVDPAKRAASSVRSHSWFDTIDWSQAEKYAYALLVTPKASATDCAHIDASFTSEEPCRATLHQQEQQQQKQQQRDTRKLYEQLVVLLGHDGSWDYSEALAAAVGAPLGQLRQAQL